MSEKLEKGWLQTVMTDVHNENWRVRAEDAEAKLKAAQAHIESQYNVFSKLDAETGALKQRLDAALAILRRVQWEWFDMRGIPGCPVCYARQRTGVHAPGCELAKLLEGK